mgnify:CR=1 FL=1
MSVFLQRFEVTIDENTWLWQYIGNYGISNSDNYDPQNHQSVTWELTAMGKESIIKTDLPRSIGRSEIVVVLPSKIKS